MPLHVTWILAQDSKQWENAISSKWNLKWVFKPKLKLNFFNWIWPQKRKGSRSWVWDGDRWSGQSWSWASGPQWPPSLGWSGRIRKEGAFINKLVNSNLGWRSLFPVIDASRPATRPSKQIARAAAEHQQEVTSLNLNFSLQTSSSRKTSQIYASPSATHAFPYGFLWET